MSNQLRVGFGINGNEVFWLQVSEQLYRRSGQLPVTAVSLMRSNFIDAFTEEEQNALLEEIVSQELDVVIGWSFPESLAYSILETGVPIVHLFETIVEHPLSVSPIGLQNIADELAHYLARRINCQGHVLVAGGLRQDGLPDDGRSRLRGVQNAFRHYPNVTYHHLPSLWLEEIARPQIEAALADWQWPIDAILGFSDSLALLTQQIALERGLCNPATPIVGINGDPQALAAIIEGRMTATVETPAVSLANNAFDIALRIVRGQPYPPHYTYNPRLITPENVAKVAAEKLVAIASIPNHLVGFEQAEQQEYQNYLETSLDISRQIGSVLDYQNLPLELARLIRTTYAYDHVQLLNWSERDQTLVSMEDLEANVAVRRIPLLQAGILSQALTQDKPIFIPDSQRSLRFAPDPAWPNTRSRVIVPIRQGGKVLGLLDLHAENVVHCTRQQLLGLQSLADQIGVAIRNAQLYAEALQAKASAEKADRLKTRLLANVSHELRNPLHIILSCAAKIDSPTPSFGESQQIQKNATHLLRIINDLLDLSRAEIDELSIAPEIIEPSAFLKDVFESIAQNGRGESTPSWMLDLPTVLPMIQADPDRLRQILLNLLSNAQKFTPTGRIILGAEVTPPYLHIWVQDTGVGIPAQLQQDVFEPFVTYSENSQRKEGIGLGLTIARRLVALHHGLMSFDSKPNEGSIFHVYLPLPNLGNTFVVPAGERQPTVLIVSTRAEISPELADYCDRQHLTRSHVASSADLEAALSHGLPTAIAWDADAPGESAWQIIQQLRTQPQLCTLPFLLYGAVADTLGQARSPVTSILLKPIKPKTLANMISGIFGSNEGDSLVIVDDDPNTRALYQQIIEEQLPGYRCQTAANGAEALSIMETTLPRLVLLDLMMPEMDGFEVIGRMRANPRTRAVPVAVLSGKILTFEDIKRLEPYPKITFHSKDVLSHSEIAQSIQQMLFDNQSLPPQTSALVKQAVAYIHQNYEQSLSRSQIAHVLGVSENYLTRIFHQESGIALWDYLNRYRVMQAKELLRNTHDNVAYISSQVGFDDPAYFSRVFRRYVGQSPRMFRNAPDQP